MKKIIKISSKIFGVLLAVLGFSACEHEQPVKYGPAPMYGVPSEMYVYGKVTGKAIEGMQVTNNADDADLL